jgi:16S rRNA (cytosine1402-N4)-methyltransferase
MNQNREAEANSRGAPQPVPRSRISRMPDPPPPASESDADRPEPPDHTPVLVEEVLSLLDPRPGQTVLDCTIGRGGHAARIMPLLAPGGRYIGLDVDPANLEHIRAVDPDPPVPLELYQLNFADAEEALEDLGLESVDGLLADLGFASSQMEDPGRGLSFSREGPLDMRLDPRLETTAADLVNRLPERELADLIFESGEERLSRRIAKKIVAERGRQPIQTTSRLRALCAEAYGPRGRRQRIDPATRTFQALRIAVNAELDRLEALLRGIPELVRPGGRAAVISFHSLEDRRVKRAFRGWVQEGRASALTKKPVPAGEAERIANPRARSARCRAVRLGGDAED